MKRSTGRVGLLAVVVESIGGLALLMLIFPVSPEPAHDLAHSPPALQVPAPVFEREVAVDTVSVAARKAERQQFVAQQLDVSRRALVALFDRHVQQLLELPATGTEVSASR